MKAIVDTSFIVSLLNPLEKHHAACVEVARSLQPTLILPVTVLPETTYLLSRWVSHRAMRRFVNQVRDPQWQIENLTAPDLRRAYQLLEQYADARLDFTDATVVALAERLDITLVLTLDRRDFSLVRPQHVDYFTVLPRRETGPA